MIVGMARRGDASPYDVTLERGADDLPGCAVRGSSREDVLERLPAAIGDFLAWTGAPHVPAPKISVVQEVESAIEADEDTEVLVSSDRAALTEESWAETQRWLASSRAELIGVLERLTEDELRSKREGSGRTVREEIEHIAFVELMYAGWTFDRQSREGLAEFLAWTRGIAGERLSALAREGAGNLTWANWGGAPRPEPWTARKAARRLVWHELLHLRAIERFPRRRFGSS
jgi:predicted RNase H-like HicB family nuclease